MFSYFFKKNVVLLFFLKLSKFALIENISQSFFSVFSFFKITCLALIFM